MYTDDLIDGLTEMAAAVHEYGSKIVMQLAHAGAFAVERLTRIKPWAVSDFEGLAKRRRHEMTGVDIQAVTQSFLDDPGMSLPRKPAEFGQRVALTKSWIRVCAGGTSLCPMDDQYAAMMGYTHEELLRDL